MITAYDYTSAVHIDTAGFDICLVGDSAAMVVHGHDNTLPITLEEMLVHDRAVARGATHPLLVGDLPFGTYDSTTKKAVDSAVRIVKGGGIDAIKLEGGSPSRITAAKAIVDAGISVMGHIGLTPQSISALGGFKAQGRNISGAVKVVESALGIGAGPFCSGQVLVYHDLLGMLQNPDHAKVTPKFCKQYARMGDMINKTLMEYKDEVTKLSFPGGAHSPYKISVSEVNGFLEELKRMGMDKATTAVAEAVEKFASYL